MALPRSFYARGAEEVAPDLLGKVLCRRVDGGVLRARVVETEAYVGTHDLACHAARGRTARTRTMFGPPGHAYVYFVYGMHHLLNVVTAGEGDAQAVLVRGAEGTAGVHGRTDGPARLTRALDITVQAHNGIDVTGGGDLWFEEGAPPHRVARGPRIGVDYAGEWAFRPLRFYDAESLHVSRAPKRVPAQG